MHAAELASVGIITAGTPDNDPGALSTWQSLPLAGPNSGAAQFSLTIPAGEVPSAAGTYLLAVRATDVDGLQHTLARTFVVSDAANGFDPNPGLPAAVMTEGSGILDYAEYCYRWLSRQ